jgi:biopolymer transport protein ExbD
MASDLSSSSVSDDMGTISAINVTPFVDVVLVLLVIFMVTAPVIVKDTFGIHLPKAQSADQKAPNISLSVAVTAQGQILLNGLLTGPETVMAEVKQAVAKDPNAHVLISADGEAKHSDVVRAIDLLKTAGMEHFAIQIEKPSS